MPRALKDLSHFGNHHAKPQSDRSDQLLLAAMIMSAVAAIAGCAFVVAYFFIH